MIFQNDDGYLLASISPDGRLAALIRYEGFDDSNLYLCHIESGMLRLITPHEGRAYYLPLYFDSDSRKLNYRAMETEDEVVEYRFDLETGAREEVERRTATFRDIVISPSRRYQAVVSDEREGSSLIVTDRSTCAVVPLEPLPQGKIFSTTISRSDRWLAFYMNGDREPTELYVCDLTTHRYSRLTSNVNVAIKREELVESETIEFKSFDGMNIPCLLWKPHGASAQQKAPALVWVHGGPIGQIRKGYAGAVQFLVNHGYAVLGVNHRGSTGYGREFLNAADKKQGREPLWDCIEAKRYLASLNYIDQQRIGIMGGSFGGYMTLAALTFHPEEFEVGIAICGVSNLVRHLEARLKQPHSAPIYLQKVGDPVEDRAMLESVSPALHAEQIKKPLMVIHGAKDPRAFKIESDDIVRQVRANGGTVEYMEFDDEAHGFRKRVNSVRAYQGILDFLERYLSSKSV
ncbi:MAG TPA: S9 family peptidase, partial [Pyrinomonadaceae bacterium]|nr:S9 family peptidase [Pyrinomonadaceae bacterium]